MEHATLDFMVALAKFYSVSQKTFDARLGGLGFQDFLVMYHISHAPDGVLRRIDLAEKMGMSASGVTRLLMPMEKIGLILKESHAHDARVSLVRLSQSAMVKYEEGLERFQLFVEEKFSQEDLASLPACTKVFQNL